MVSLSKIIRRMKFIDIGANLTDRMYHGEYNGSSKHPPDLSTVISRAKEAGVVKMMVTGGSLDESRLAIDLCRQYPGYLYATVGCHPTRCSEFETKYTFTGSVAGSDEGESEPSNTKEGGEGAATAYLTELQKLIRENRDVVVAVGECGLDAERTQFCPLETQVKYFSLQLSLAQDSGLPLFLHCRGAEAATLLREKLSLARDAWAHQGGVVHSFDGSSEERDAFLELGLHIGINGCSLKTEENLSVMKDIPSSRLLLETDCPWCEVRPSHAGYKHIKTWPQTKPVDKKKWVEGALVKGRNEPSNMRQVLEVVASVRGHQEQELADIVLSNTETLFFQKKS